MKRVYIMCTVVVLLMFTGVFASGYKGSGSKTGWGGIGQSEGFGILGENMISVVGVCGSAESGNMVEVSQQQSIGELCKTLAKQSESSMLTQTAEASGKCGFFGVLQVGGIEGAQEQLSTTSKHKDVKTQQQWLDLGLMQNVTKDGGIGGASGAQASVSQQNQSQIVGGTLMKESQFVGTAQLANVSGGIWTDASAISSIAVSTAQSQTSR